jgi:ABC-type nitrate/sulfonate/bicarbonate transport system permease component
MRSGLYLSNFWVTLCEALLGFVIAAVTGIMLGAVIAQFRLMEQTFYPYLVALQTLPKIAIAPLIIVWFGFGISSKVIIAATVAFFPVLVNVIVGLKTIDPAKLDLMRSLRASRWQTFRLVTFPNALPFVFAGLDIAVVFSVLGAIVGEAGQPDSAIQLLPRHRGSVRRAHSALGDGGGSAPHHAGGAEAHHLLGGARRDHQRMTAVRALGPEREDLR